MAKIDCHFMMLGILCGVILIVGHKTGLGLTVASVFGLLFLMKLHQLIKLNKPTVNLTKKTNPYNEIK